MFNTGVRIRAITAPRFKKYTVFLFLFRQHVYYHTIIEYMFHKRLCLKQRAAPSIHRARGRLGQPRFNGICTPSTTFPFFFKPRLSQRGGHCCTATLLHCQATGLTRRQIDYRWYIPKNASSCTCDSSESHPCDSDPAGTTVGLTTPWNRTTRLRSHEP